ncbi:putative DNA-binding protein [Brevibacillus phage SecTim467]|uniref:HTH cro/C1-type domain-containing protein n=2 Tax=Jenstvirus jenst TaxID=1982225 RepID=A0A0K2CP26_9CAUD|nr:HTH DNA binding protein [Brevibacillus phage Jenst]ALA07294.1 hypothetical protein JENST_165 [Brevibacillus phage Jenst]ALA07493.1 putative DNA-binding protein [Brevibacillus phage SecTim467]
MARLPLPYKTNNELTRFLMMEQARRVTNVYGSSRPSLLDLETELAEYCSVQPDTINLMRRNKTQPSLPTAIKVCEWLGVAVEDVFRLVPNPEYKGK